jgi:DNA replication and repair protein RecF
MYIPHLEVSQVRNLKSLKTDCHPLANIIYGVNGSGKTSLLEAIYLLGRGRSFRHRDLRLVVNHQAEELVVSAKIEKGMPAKVHQMGVRRTSSGKFAGAL